MKLLITIPFLLLVFNTASSQVNKKSASIDSVNSRNISIPHPVISIGSQNGMTNLKNGIRADVKNLSSEGIFCKIEKFSVTVITNTDDSIQYTNIGDSFTKLYKEIIPILQGNEKLIFHDFFVLVGSEYNPRKLDTTFIFTYTKNKLNSKW